MARYAQVGFGYVLNGLPGVETLRNESFKVLGQTQRFQTFAELNHEWCFVKLSPRVVAKIRCSAQRRLLEICNKLRHSSAVTRRRRTAVSPHGWNQSSFSKECRDG